MDKSTCIFGWFVRLVVLVVVGTLYLVLFSHMLAPKECFWFRIINMFTMFPQLFLTWMLVDASTIYIKKDNYPCRSILGVFVKFFGYVEGFLGIAGTAWLFGWDEQFQARTQSAEETLTIFGTIIIVSIVGSIIMSGRSLSHEGLPKSRHDWMMLKNDLTIAGYDVELKTNRNK